MPVVQIGSHPNRMDILASLFNLGGFDTVLIILVVMLLFGAKRLPGLARGISQSIREFGRGKEEPAAPEPVEPPPPLAPAETMPVATRRR